MGRHPHPRFARLVLDLRRRAPAMSDAELERLVEGYHRVRDAVQAQRIRLELLDLDMLDHDQVSLRLTTCALVCLPELGRRPEQRAPRGYRPTRRAS